MGDVTERKSVARQLHENAVRLAGEKEAFQAAMDGAPLETSLAALVRTGVALTYEDARCAFYIANAARTELKHITGMGEAYSRCVDGFKIGRNSLACGLAVYTGKPVVTPDVTAEPLWKDWLGLARDYDYRAVWSFPIETVAGEVVGTFAMYFREARRATPRDYEIAAAMTQAAAIIISRHNEAEERAKTEAELRDSQERYRFLAAIVESSDDAIITKNLDSIITSWNEGAKQIFGYSAEEVIGRSVTILMPPDRHDEESMILDRIRSGHRIEHYETVRQRKDGSLIDISLTVSPVRNSEGVVVGASKIARDITERKRAEELVAMLANEAEHRAKNVLSIVLATVRLSSAETQAEFKRVVEGRIKALADVHALFVESRWKGAELRSIVDRELSPYNRTNDARTLIEGPSVMLEPETAQAIAVTIHELATNAAKYGSLSVSEGRVRIECSREPDDQLKLRWIEAGGPAVKPPANSGFGTKVMHSMVANRDGRLDFSWHPSGLVCEITLPVA